MKDWWRLAWQSANRFPWKAWISIGPTCASLVCHPFLEKPCLTRWFYPHTTSSHNGATGLVMVDLKNNIIRWNSNATKFYNWFLSDKKRLNNLKNNFFTVPAKESISIKGRPRVDFTNCQNDIWAKSCGTDPSPVLVSRIRFSPWATKNSSAFRAKFITFCRPALVAFLSMTSNI